MVRICGFHRLFLEFADVAERKSRAIAVGSMIVSNLEERLVSRECERWMEGGNPVDRIWMSALTAELLLDGSSTILSC